MKNIALLISLTILIVSCTTQPSTQKNVELIDRYVQAVEDLDFETMDDLLADEYYGLGPSYGDSIKKPEAIANLKNSFENLYQSIDYDRSRNLAVTVPDGPDRGEWVSNWAELTIVYKDDQKKVRIWANTVYQIKEGKIVKSMTFYNEADVLEQLGYVFINPNDL
jgi:hypothetical protein